MLMIGSAHVLRAKPQKYIHTDSVAGTFSQPQRHFTHNQVDVGGINFTSQLWTSLANLLGITLQQTTTYNPAADGMVECFHRTLKAALMSRYNDSNWFTQLPWVPLGLRTTPKDTLDVSPADMVSVNPLVIPAEFFLSTTSSDNMQHLTLVLGKFTLQCQIYKPPAKQHIATYLLSAMYIFLHNDTSRSPLTILTRALSS
ncbi:uncharacterized protein [Palaemon carinicauda]|uniref:uncharacterized protein n=1 Tax=Palaemon carinicauda TaxID=392227 RepID=UPI0035B6468D